MFHILVTGLQVHIEWKQNEIEMKNTTDYWLKPKDKLLRPVLTLLVVQRLLGQTRARLTSVGP